MDDNYASRASRFNALLRLGQAPNVDNIDLEERKRALMGQDIDQEQLRQFAADQMALDQGGVEKRTETMGFDEQPSVQEQRFTPEELERKRQAIERLYRGQ
jgi:hypothetical protein